VRVFVIRIGEVDFVVDSDLCVVVDILILEGFHIALTFNYIVNIIIFYDIKKSGLNFFQIIFQSKLLHPLLYERFHK